MDFIGGRRPCNTHTQHTWSRICGGGLKIANSSGFQTVARRAKVVRQASKSGPRHPEEF